MGRHVVSFFLLCVVLFTGYPRFLVLGVDITLPLPPELDRSMLGEIRLDYHPSAGVPPPNVTFHAYDVEGGIVVDEVIPGTDYAFQLFYSNRTTNEILTWTTVLPTEPEPARNLSVEVLTANKVRLTWDPPLVGGYTDFLIMFDSSEDEEDYVTVENDTFSLDQDLTPGASVEISLYTLFNMAISSVFESADVVTSKSPTPDSVTLANNRFVLCIWGSAICRL